MTYSIVAYDPDAGQMGVAVQTFYLATGAWVPWVEGGVGAVATQADAERSYGILGLDLMRGGKRAPDALAALLAVDARREHRQVSMVDAAGRVATHTGARCFPEAGSTVGAAFCTQANMMARDTVWDAMAEAYRGASGDLAARLMAALDAAQAEGGDLRGRQTAALLVAEQGRIPLIDLRVDHHPEPLGELHRLLRLHRAYTAIEQVAGLIEAGDQETASRRIDQIDTDEPYLHYMRALHLAGHFDRWEEALEVLKRLIDRAPLWAEYLRREARADTFGILGLGKRLLAALDMEQGNG